MRFERYGLANILNEDVAALQARIAKVMALAMGGAERRREAAHPAELYHAIFSRTGGYGTLRMYRLRRVGQPFRGSGGGPAT